MEKGTIRVLGIIAGAFYILGGLAAAFLIASLGAIDKGLGGSIPGLGNAEAVIVAVGVIVGALIIAISATLVMSNKRGSRVAGGILIIILCFVGLTDTFAGLVIGFILALIAGIMAIVNKDQVSTQGAPAAESFSFNQEEHP